MSGDDLVKAIIEHYGVWGIVLLMGVLIVITVFIKTITNFEWIKTLLVKPHLDSDKLSDHIFFKSAKSKLKYVIPTLDIVPDKPITQQVFIDLIYLTVESFYYGCKNIINTQNLKGLSSDEWSLLLKNEISSMLKSYKQKAVDFKIPAQIIEKYSNWLDQYITTLEENIELVANATSLRNSADRTNIFLLIINVLLIALIGDIRRIANDTNYQFSGLEYRGNLLE